MRCTISRTAALLAISIPLAVAQLQANKTICNWAGLRAGIIRDTIYLDGGSLWWQSGTTDGTTDGTTGGSPILERNSDNDGLMYTFNLSYAFDTRTFNETTSLIQPFSKTGGTAGNNLARNYIDGALFANEGEFYLYGGLVRATDSLPSVSDAQSVLGYEAYQYGPERSGWSRGFLQSTLTENVTRHVSNGAAVSIPSENLGFYFSGFRGSEWGSITTSTDDLFPANTLIDVDMSIMRGEQWANNTLPDDIPPRVGAELVWIPVGGQGALIAIGGMTTVEYRLPAGLNSSQVSDAEQQAPGFMTSLPVYDIVTETWYIQNTTGDGPGQLTLFCSVVATANDSSSFSIYIYGGYDGLNSTSVPSDDVWILSIPSFTWIKAYTGVRGRGRRGHRCERIYPDQMLIIGGVNPDTGKCLEDGPLRIFNLNSLEFQNVYDPREWSEYIVPDIVTTVIGGIGSGGSTRTATYSDDALSSLFGTPYTKTINRYYPYAAASDPPGTSALPTATPNSGGLAKWVAPVLGVVLGLIVLSIIAVLILLYRRRKLLRRNSITSSNAGSSSNNRILNWVNGMPNQPSDRKTDPSVTSTEVESDVQVSSPLAGFSEVGGRQRYEVEAKERPVAELATDFNVPRPIDFAYEAGISDKPSQSQPSGNGSQTQIHGLGLTAPSSAVSPQSPRSTVTHLHSNSGDSTAAVHAHAPSPHALPHRPEDVGGGAATFSPVTAPSPLSSAARSPDLQNTGVSGGGGGGVAAGTSGSDGLERRPTHHRNISSLSSHIYQLPSPDVPFSPDEERRRSQILSGLSPSQEAAMRTGMGTGMGSLGALNGAAASGMNQRAGEVLLDQLVSPEGVRVEPPSSGLDSTNTSNVVAAESKKTAGKKSSFGEVLDDGGDGGSSSRKS